MVLLLGRNLPIATGFSPRGLGLAAGGLIFAVCDLEVKGEAAHKNTLTTTPLPLI